jgi:cellulose synthase/poly-beta-1,6-N-acetylglucosamine synthase-like glycosyltransferase
MRSLVYPRNRLEVIVIDDGSTDDTAQIVRRFSQKDARVRLFAVPPAEAARGKSHALNLGLNAASHDLIAVYDADNRPEPESLKFLVTALLDKPGLAAVFGKFRTLNKRRNLLTGFINIETLSFQYMVQAGRYLVSGIAILPGTNFVIRRDALTASGGWDEAALTEDTELSIRLYQQGHEIKFLPYAVTWEEEPERWGTWLRQRTRWVRGNFYVLRKYLLPSFRFRKLSLTLELIYLFLLYYLFLGAILLSHLFFIASGLGWIAVLAPGPYFAVWVCAFALFVVELSLTAAYEDELTLKNIGIILLMYFTYCQAWIILVFRALYQEFRQKGKVEWEKTRRFGTG